MGRASLVAGADTSFDHQNLIGKLREHDTALDALEGGVNPVVNVKTFGAVGDGVTDDRAAIQAALDSLTLSGGGELFFPPGTYLVPQFGAFSLDLKTSNTVITGVRGRTWIKHGPTTSACGIWRVNRKHNVVFRGMGFDGGWTNPVVRVDRTMNGLPLPQAVINVRVPDEFASLAAMGFPASGTVTIADDSGGQVINYTSLGTTSFNGCSGGIGTLITGAGVGRQDSQAGIVHTTQATPQNHALQVRGSEDVLIKDCLFRQIYGDGIWLAHDADNLTRGCRNVNVTDTVVEVSARNCMTITGRCQDIHIARCWFLSPWTTAFDTEDCIARDIHLDTCYLDAWFNPAGHGGGINPLSIVGGQTSLPGPAIFATGYRVINCEIKGPVIIEAARDILLQDCTIEVDYSTNSPAAIVVQFVSENIILDNVNVYDRGGSAGGHEAAIQLSSGSAGNNQISQVVIRGGNVVAQNGRYGISVHGTGGRAGAAGVASSVTATTLQDSGNPGWTTDQFVAQLVRCGTFVAEITGNTNNALTLDRWTRDLGSPFGDAFPTPAAGAYEILASGMYVVVDGVQIDCTNRGFGNGGYGVFLRADNVGMRARVNECNIRNSNGPAIRVEPPGSPNTWRDIELIDNVAYDDQVTPTCTAVVSFGATNLNQIARTTMRNNKAAGGVAANLAGLTGGVWLVNDGPSQQWQGFGAPTFTAPRGSTYVNVTGAAGTTLYVNETGTNVWAAK